jgi:hypothetical protein
MYNLNSNRAWKRAIAKNAIVNRATRRAAANAARIVALDTPTVQTQLLDAMDCISSADVSHQTVARDNHAVAIKAAIVPTADGTVTRIYTRPYVVIGADGFRVLVRAASTPEGYDSVMGPFKTTRGAKYVFAHPEVTSVREAERLAAEA